MFYCSKLGKKIWVKYSHIGPFDMDSMSSRDMYNEVVSNSAYFLDIYKRNNTHIEIINALTVTY